jgi:RNA polymerase sigma-70 factor (ECF subfamily)
MPALDVEHTYLRYFPIIREKCSRMLRDRAEAQDIAQETFARLWSARDQLHDPDAVASWIYMTSTRLAVDRYRSARRQDQGELATDDVAGSDLDAGDRVDAVRMLARIAKHVPADELEIAILSRIDGLGHEEIARVLGCSDRTVRRRLQSLESRLSRLRESA